MSSEYQFLDVGASSTIYVDTVKAVCIVFCQNIYLKMH